MLADLLKGILPVWLYLKTGGDSTGMGLVLVLAASGILVGGGH